MDKISSILHNVYIENWDYQVQIYIEVLTTLSL